MSIVRHLANGGKLGRWLYTAEPMNQLNMAGLQPETKSSSSGSSEDDALKFENVLPGDLASLNSRYREIESGLAQLAGEYAASSPQMMARDPRWAALNNELANFGPAYQAAKNDMKAWESSRKNAETGGTQGMLAVDEKGRAIYDQNYTPYTVEGHHREREADLTTFMGANDTWNPLGAGKYIDTGIGSGTDFENHINAAMNEAGFTGFDTSNMARDRDGNLIVDHYADNGPFENFYNIFYTHKVKRHDNFDQVQGAVQNILDNFSDNKAKIGFHRMFAAAQHGEQSFRSVFPERDEDGEVKKDEKGNPIYGVVTLRDPRKSEHYEELFETEEYKNAETTEEKIELEKWWREKMFQEDRAEYLAYRVQELADPHKHSEGYNRYEPSREKAGSYTGEGGSPTASGYWRKAFDISPSVFTEDIGTDMIMIEPNPETGEQELVRVNTVTKAGDVPNVNDIKEALPAVGSKVGAHKRVFTVAGLPFEVNQGDPVWFVGHEQQIVALPVTQHQGAFGGKGYRVIRSKDEAKPVMMRVTDPETNEVHEVAVKDAYHTQPVVKSTIVAPWRWVEENLDKIPHLHEAVYNDDGSIKTKEKITLEDPLKWKALSGVLDRVLYQTAFVKNEAEPFVQKVTSRRWGTGKTTDAYWKSLGVPNLTGGMASSGDLIEIDVMWVPNRGGMIFSDRTSEHKYYDETDIDNTNWDAMRMAMQNMQEGKRFELTPEQLKKLQNAE